MIADKGSRDLFELDPAGGLLRRIDVDFPASVRPSGVTIAPGSENPVLRNYYVTDRGVDNDVDPLENDGRLFEVVAVPLLGNGAPSVDAGSDQTIAWPTAEVSLAGQVSDDGHPYPPSAVATSWSLESGPGDVTFADASSLGTTATFSAPGSYVLRLLADDSDLSTTDTVTVHLTQSFTLSVTWSGAGTVTMNPPGGVYEEGSTVTLRALPASGFFFGGWSGDASGSGNPLPVVMDADAAIHAQFNAASSAGACGVGPELVALLPPLGWLLGRRRAKR